jgi:hypothetical protein
VAGWTPGPVWTGAENLATTGITSPDRPARSQSLYRLRYPAHFHSYNKHKFMYFYANFRFCKLLPLANRSLSPMVLRSFRVRRQGILGLSTDKQQYHIVSHFCRSFDAKFALPPVHNRQLAALTQICCLTKSSTQVTSLKIQSRQHHTETPAGRSHVESNVSIIRQ